MCAVQTDTFMIDCIQNSTCTLIGVRCTSMDGGTPLLRESSSNIFSHRQLISIHKGMMKHGYLLYALSNLPSSLPLKISALRSLPLSRLNLNIHYSNKIWRMERSPTISQIAVPVWFSFEHNFLTQGIPFTVYVERRMTVLNQVARLVWVPYVDLRPPQTCWRTRGIFALMHRPWLLVPPAYYLPKFSILASMFVWRFVCPSVCRSAWTLWTRYRSHRLTNHHQTWHKYGPLVRTEAYCFSRSKVK